MVKKTRYTVIKLSAFGLKNGVEIVDKLEETLFVNHEKEFIAPVLVLLMGFS